MLKSAETAPRLCEARPPAPVRRDGRPWPPKGRICPGSGQAVWD